MLGMHRGPQETVIQLFGGQPRQQSPESHVDDCIQKIKGAIDPRAALATHDCKLSTAEGAITLRTGKSVDATLVRETMLRLELMQATSRPEYDIFVGTVHSPQILPDAVAQAATTFGLLLHVDGRPVSLSQRSARGLVQTLQCLSRCAERGEFTGPHYQINPGVKEVILAGTSPTLKGFDLVNPEQTQSQPSRTPLEIQE